MRKIEFKSCSAEVYASWDIMRATNRKTGKTLTARLMCSTSGMVAWDISSEAGVVRKISGKDNALSYMLAELGLPSLSALKRQIGKTKG